MIKLDPKSEKNWRLFVEQDHRPKTILCDIDGTLVKHTDPTQSSNPDYELELLPGTLKKLIEWDRKGYGIVLITGRRESSRAATEKQLARAGIFYDQLIMGIGGGKRIIINDRKPDGIDACDSISINRNSGIANIEI